MRMRYSEPHTLVITEVDPEADDSERYDWDVVHPDTCPTDMWSCPLTGGSYEVHTCWVQHEIDNAGFDSFGTVDEIGGTGSYRFRMWGSGPDYRGEYDGGVEFLEEVLP